MISTDSATVKADVVTIAPFVVGDVSSVAVADNQTVRAGELLARIDSRAYQLKVSQAQAAVSAAEAHVTAQQARLAHIVAQGEQQRQLIAQATAAVTADETDAHLTAAVYQRQSDLAHQEVTSTRDLEAARAQQQKAAARAKLSGAASAAGGFWPPPVPRWRPT